MRKGIHPQYFEDALIKCACGAEFHVGSTRKEMQVELCSNCHPFYTGKEKLVDTAGRVDKFKERIEAAEKFKTKSKEKEKKADKKEENKEESAKEK